MERRGTRREYSFPSWLLVSTCLLGCFSSALAVDSYTVAPAATETINEHSACYGVTNNHASGRSIMVPTKTAAEWSSGAHAFVNGAPSGVSVVACASCGTQAVTWSTYCTASSGASQAHGDSRVITDSAYGAANYTGSTTITCNNGTLSTSGATCYAPCVFDSTYYAHGSSVTAWHAYITCGCGSEQRTCNNGTFSGTYEYPLCIEDCGAGE